MMGRDTPSRGLDLTAQYVADQFRRFGLKTSFQRYPITRRRLEPAHSRVIFAAGGQKDTASFLTAARYNTGLVPEPAAADRRRAGGRPAHGRIRGTAQCPGQGRALRPASRGQPRRIQQVLRVLFLAGSKALVILSGRGFRHVCGSRFRSATQSAP